MLHVQKRKDIPQLVKGQHILSASIIRRFYNQNNTVEIRYKNSNRIIQRGRKSELFTAHLAWDQRAEIGYMKLIETKLIHIVDNIHSPQQSYENRDHAAITKYSLLWHLRHSFNKNRPENEYIPHITSPKLSESEKNILDRLGICYILEEGEYLSKYIASTQIYAYLSLLMDKYKDLKWGLLITQSGEFVVPDCCKNYPCVPIAPNMAFFAETQDMLIPEKKLVDINRNLILNASEYYFAKSLKNCPIY